MRINDVILQTVSKVVIFIILTLAFYLFFEGHNAPGGGFVAGLILASSFILLLLAFDLEVLRKNVPENFRIIATIGATLILSTSFIPVFFGKPFLTQFAFDMHLPIIGSYHFSTTTFFELGVSLTVLGVVMTIMLAISEDVD